MAYRPENKSDEVQTPKLSADYKRLQPESHVVRWIALILVMVVAVVALILFVRSRT